MRTAVSQGVDVVPNAEHGDAVVANRHADSAVALPEDTCAEQLP